MQCYDQNLKVTFTVNISCVSDMIDSACIFPLFRVSTVQKPLYIVLTATCLCGGLVLFWLYIEQKW